VLLLILWLHACLPGCNHVQPDVSIGSICSGERVDRLLLLLLLLLLHSLSAQLAISDTETNKISGKHNRQQQ
jgi:hypothetical protein